MPSPTVWDGAKPFICIGYLLWGLTVCAFLSVESLSAIVLAASVGLVSSGLPAFESAGTQGLLDEPVYQYAADFCNEARCPLLIHEALSAENFMEYLLGSDKFYNQIVLKSKS